MRQSAAGLRRRRLQVGALRRNRQLIAEFERLSGKKVILQEAAA